MSFPSTDPQSLILQANQSLNTALAKASPPCFEKKDKSLEKIQAVYHIKLQEFQGNTLYSLNELETFPEYKTLALKAAKKYEGREELRKQKILPFNCLWNDVVFTSIVHPDRILKALRDAGYSPIPVQFFEIPIEALKFKKIVIWKCPTEEWTPSSKTTPDQYHEYSLDIFEKLQEVPQETEDYYKKCLLKGEKPLLFKGLPHLFIHDSLDISSMKTIIWA